jgi:arylsulfatase A-like enzyme
LVARDTPPRRDRLDDRTLLLAVGLEGEVVPCVLSWPARVPAGERRPGLVRTMDVAPTVLDALGLADVAMAEWLPGQSLLPLAEARDDRGTVAELYLTDGATGTRGWRTRQWHLPAPPDGDLPPEVARELTARMHGHARRRAAETGRADPLG